MEAIVSILEKETSCVAVNQVTQDSNVEWTWMSVPLTPVNVPTTHDVRYKNMYYALCSSYFKFHVILARDRITACMH